MPQKYGAKGPGSGCGAGACVAASEVMGTIMLTVLVRRGVLEMS